MLKYFGISFRDKLLSNYRNENIKIIQVAVNLNNKLKHLKYIRNGRLDINFSDEFIGKGETIKYDLNKNSVYKNDTLYSGIDETICHIYSPFTKAEQEKLFSRKDYLEALLLLSINQLKEYWKIKGWDESDLDRIQQEILEEDFKLSVELLKASNDSKSYKAVINAHYFKEYCNIEIELYKKRQLLDKQLLFKAQIHTPFMFSFYKSVLGGIIWIDEDEFEIKSLFVGLVYKIKVVNDKLEFVITPENNKYDPVRFLVDSLRYGKTAEESAELYKRAMRGY